MSVGRYSAATAFRALLAASVLVGALVLSACSGTFVVNIHNDSALPTPAMALVPSNGATVTVPALASGQSVTLSPVLGDGENTLAIVETDGRKYFVLGYFEGKPSGSVDVRISSQQAGVLGGLIDDWTSYFPSGVTTLTPVR